MSSLEWPDLSRLASLARDQSLDVRPVLLRVHTDLFVAAPSRDRATIEAFEALALGFLPIVDDATAAMVAHKLAGFADTPRTIIDALIRREGEARKAVLQGAKQLADAALRQSHVSLSAENPKSLDGSEVADLLALQDEEVDLALARSRHVRLHSSQLQELVDRGRERPHLAMALLDRPDLGPGDEAVLYLHADDARRTQIRSRIEPAVALAGRSPPLSRADQDAVEALLGFARALDTSGFEAQLARMLHPAPAPDWRFQMEPRRELLALALVAAGVAPEHCIRIFLTLDPAISRSVRTVFHLAQIAKNVTRPVAIYLVEAILGVTVEAKHEGRYVPAADSSPPSVRDRARPTVSQIRAAVLARRAG